MDCAEQQHEEDEVMGVPEIDGDLLAELLDASLADAEEHEHDDEVTGPQLGFTADVFDGWVESHELNSIHPHHDCEDCGLDNGGVLSDLDELDGCGYSRSPSPYVAFDDDDAAQWTKETGEAALGPFMGERMDEWYMDGMAMKWEEEDEGNSLSFGPYYGGEVGMDQVYGSPLWE